MATQFNHAAVEPIFPIVKNEQNELVHQTPEQLSPHYITGEGNAADKARRAMIAVSSALASLNTKYVKGAPDFERSLEAAYRETIGPALEQARASAKAEAGELDKALSEQTGFKVDPSMRALVVGTFQSLSPNDRVAAIDKLIEEGDGGTLAVLSELSPVLTKLPDEVRGGIKPRLFSKSDAGTFKRLQDAQRNLARLEAGSVASANAYARFSAPQNHFASAKPEVNKSVAE